MRQRIVNWKSLDGVTILSTAFLSHPCPIKIFGEKACDTSREWYIDESWVERARTLQTLQAKKHNNAFQRDSKEREEKYLRWNSVTLENSFLEN